MARVAQIIIWAVIVVLGVLAYWAYLRSPQWTSKHAHNAKHPPTPAVATEFEMQVRQLGLSKLTYADSTELRRWCERNRNRYYVPEWLLDGWQMQVDSYFSW